MNKKIRIFSVAAALTSNVHAAVVIDFTNQAGLYDLNVTKDVMLNDPASATSFTMTVTGTGGVLNSNSESFGIANDLIDDGESISISFDVAVEINFIDFSRIGATSIVNDDKASVTLGSSSPVLLYSNRTDFNGTTDVWTLSSPVYLGAGELITIGAGDVNASYSLQRLNVTAVPEPSSFLLLGFGGLTLLSRRKRPASSNLRNVRFHRPSNHNS